MPTKFSVCISETWEVRNRQRSPSRQPLGQRNKHWVLCVRFGLSFFWPLVTSLAQGYSTVKHKQEPVTKYSLFLVLYWDLVLSTKKAGTNTIFRAQTEAQCGYVAG